MPAQGSPRRDCTGHDKLLGGDGHDLLNGGSGNDELNGGSGRDVLTGGGGEDVFRWNAAGDSPRGVGRDVVTDFVRGVDTLDLGGIDANVLVSGNQAFAFIGTAQFAAGVAGQVRGEILLRADGTTVTLVQADVDGDRVADFELQMNGSHNLGASDFVL